MSYRIELLFVGDAPDGELERAKILAKPEVTDAIMALSQVLEGVGFQHLVNARTVRGTERKRKATGPALVESAAE
jgi:hypothetical protein